MPDLFIANPTAQICDFHYTPKGKKASRKQEIQPGGQIKISGNLTPVDIESIIRQHEKYGMVAVTEIARAGRGAVIPLIWSEKPVPAAVIAGVVHVNREVLDGRGRKFRDEAAVSVHNSMEEATKGFGPLRLNELETSIEELNPTDDRKGLAHEEIHEVTRVTRREDPHGPERGGQKAKRGAAKSRRGAQRAAA